MKLWHLNRQWQYSFALPYMSYVHCWRGFVAHSHTSYIIICKVALESKYRLLFNLHIVQMWELNFLECLLSTSSSEHDGLPSTVSSSYFANREILGASLPVLVKKYRVHSHWPKGLHKSHEKHTTTKLALCNWPVFTNMNYGHSFSSRVNQTSSPLHVGIQLFMAF